jgi:hypothetical protein
MRTSGNFGTPVPKNFVSKVPPCLNVQSNPPLRGNRLRAIVVCLTKGPKKFEWNFFRDLRHESIAVHHLQIRVRGYNISFYLTGHKHDGKDLPVKFIRFVK